ncbi:MAG TPA: glycosyltransferase family 2 protein [Bryobacteraceae bacterium]
MLHEHGEHGKIGVVTVTYNGAAVIREFLDSLDTQTHSNFVLYVVDNASNDGVLDVVNNVSRFPVRVTANPDNRGVAEGNNQGIRAALADGCECVLLLNNDTAFPPDLIEQLYLGLDGQDCDMTTAKMYYSDRPTVFWCAGGRFQAWRGYDVCHDGAEQEDSGQYDEPRQVTYSPTCCLMVRRRVFYIVGVMDRSYFAYYDDADFLYRCLKRRVSLWYIPKARLWHKVSSSTGSVSDFTLRHCARNHIYFLRKNLPYWFAFIWYLQSNVRSTLAFALRQNSRSKWRLRLAAAREGWKCPIEVGHEGGVP